MKLTLLAPLLAAVVVAGCGGGDKSEAPASTPAATQAASSSSGGGQTLKLAADPKGAIKFDKTSLDAKAGKVTIAFTNKSSIPHAVEIEGKGLEKETKVVTGADASLTASLKPGTYEFYCPVGDHKEEGMKGTLTVK